MKAVVMTGYGGIDVLAYQERPMPVCGRGQVLVRVQAAGVNPIDWRVRKGTLKEFVRVKPPLILGAEIAGEISEVGPEATQFKRGDKVYAKLPGDIGGYAEYVATDQANVALRPANLSAVEAAAVPVGTTTSLQSLRDKAHLLPGQRVLVNGASGGVGLFAVQLARELGADVTAVCSRANFDFVRGFGAGETLDYKTSDFTKLGRTWHVIFDVSATRKFRDCRRALEPAGTYVTTISSFGDMLVPLFNPFRSQKGRYIICQCSQPDLNYLRGLVEAGKVRPAVERTFPLERSGAAQEYLETARPKGKVVLEVAA